MAIRVRSHPVALLLAGLAACASSSVVSTAAAPNAHATLTSAERARQTANRLTYGARPADITAIEQLGPEKWIERQLHPERIVDTAADRVLDQLEITHKSAFELAADHPQANELGISPVQLRPADSMMAMSRMAPRDSTMSALAELQSMRASQTKTEERQNIAGRLQQTRTAVNRELPPSIVLRAQLSDRQLLEVMTSFWENHFSVSADVVPFPFFLVDYDHEIRAHALGKFRDLLGAVAHSPTMLLYLDNASSTVDSVHPTQFEWRMEQRRAAHPPFGDTALVRGKYRRRGGINENYARELMELHTLGVDGGYTQQDVQEVARCFTGWTVENILNGGTFAFQQNGHDAGEKTVLGVRIPGGRGMEDGEQVLDLLARHPSTARFIARKLVIRFVSDSPPPALVDRAAATFRRTDGDIREVLRTILLSPEFNDRAAFRAKVKTPFEFVTSVLRTMSAAPDTTQQTAQLMTGLGQRIFGRATPDGWPDQAVAWMNSGAIMNRVNLAGRVAANQLPTISLDRWPASKALLAMTPEARVNGVIDAILAGQASTETREAMTALPASSPRQHLTDLVALALGSSDFQRR